MITGGPVGSPYPGTPFMLIVVGFCAFVLGKSVLSAYRDRRRKAATLQNPARHNPGARVLVGVMAAFLLFMAVWAIWIHSTAR